MAQLPEKERIHDTPMLRGPVDYLIAASIFAAVALLFYIDSVEPRGVIDGVGYPAAVAASARFGKRALLLCAAACTALIIIAHFLLPNTGISVAGELGNRLFSLVSIWIIAELMRRQLSTEALTVQRAATLRQNQAALVRMVREALASGRSFIDSVKLVTEIASRALDADYTGVFRFYDQGFTLHCIDVYGPKTGQHIAVPDVHHEDPLGYDLLMGGDYVMIVEDIKTFAVGGPRKQVLAQFGVGALLSAGILVDSKLAGQIIFTKSIRPYHWTEEEVAFARAAGSICTSLFAAELNNRLLAALDLVGEGIYTENLEGVPVYANRAAIDIAAPSSEAGSLAVPDILFPKPLGTLADTVDLNQVRFGERDLEIQRTRLPDGGIISRMNDVSQRNAAQREHDRLQARLLQSEKLEAVGQLAGGIAHDFNNILGAIMGFARFLAQDLPTGSEQNSFATRILSASERGKELIEQILAFVNTGGSKAEIVDLGPAVQQSAELVQGSLPSIVAFELAADGDGLFVKCGTAQLSQLILNLCINARDAIGNGPGKIALEVMPVDGAEPATLAAGLSDTEITIGEADPRLTYARIRVRDTGGGITPDVMRRIFEPFYTTKARQRGTGLGLAVVRGIIDSCRGFAHVRTIPGDGTEFSIYVPLAEAAATLLQDEKLASHLLRGTERVLVVDDEPDIVDMMVIGLERLGYQAVGVTDSLEAFKAVSEEPDAFDVLVTDLLMPGMLGTELIRKVKVVRPDIRTILCTAFSGGAGEEQDLRDVADAVFRKPADAAAIAASMRTMCSAATERVLQS